ncbi:MAG: flavodoxin family protein [Spirochaetia bacterium]|jgi:multimeric flavodoxin WrbA
MIISGEDVIEMSRVETARAEHGPDAERLTTRLLAVNASPRRNGRTAELLTAALTAARGDDAEVKLIHLVDYDIRRCRGCYACVQGPCPQKDDMSRLLADMQAWTGGAVLYGAPVFNFNVPGLLVDYWNRKTGMSGYFRARHDGTVDSWLAHQRAWTVGGGMAQASHSGGEKVALRHLNFALLGEAARVFPGLAAHAREGQVVLARAAQLGRRLVAVSRRAQAPYPLGQMALVYKRRTCFEFPRP